MNKDNAKKILLMLDRINKELDWLGDAILREKMKTAPVRVRNDGKFRIGR